MMKRTTIVLFWLRTERTSNLIRLLVLAIVSALPLVSGQDTAAPSTGWDTSYDQTIILSDTKFNKFDRIPRFVV